MPPPIEAARAQRLRVLMSETAHARLGSRIDALLGAGQWQRVAPGEDADIALVSRDVTGLSTKHAVLPDTQAFYDAMLGAPSLRWVHLHSAGADRPVFVELRRRGIELCTSSGANAPVVVQSALAGVLSLARHFPLLHEAQQDRRWRSLVESGLPRDLAGQCATVVGWGPIGQGLGGLLRALGLDLQVVRAQAQPAEGASATVAYESLAQVLPRSDWLLLACPLSDRTRALVDRQALSLLPAGARVVNVARGELIDEPALIEALQAGRLAGAYLDVFAHEPLPAESPLWSMPGVIVTPHSAGHSDGNEARVDALFLDNLARHARGDTLHQRVA